MLTARTIQALLKRKRKTDTMHADGNNLYLRIRVSGAASWVYRYQVNGKRKAVGLGPLKHVELAEARSKAAAYGKLVYSGVHDVKQHKALCSYTLQQAASDYIEQNASLWSASHAQQWRRSLEMYVYPDLGTKLVADLTTQDISQTLAKIWDEKHDTAKKVRNRLELILDRAKTLGYLNENPARWKGCLDKVFKSKISNKHHAAIPWPKMPLFIKEWSLNDREYKSWPTSKLALMLVILTAARASEITKLKWSECDLKEGVIKLPAERMKNKKPHVIPLSYLARELLTFMQTRTKNSAYVFASRSKTGHISNAALQRFVKPWGATIHGFRSTFADFAEDATHVQKDVVEAALSHVSGTRTERAYRRTDRIQKRAELMELWTSYLLKDAAWLEYQATNETLHLRLCL